MAKPVQEKHATVEWDSRFVWMMRLHAAKATLSHAAYNPGNKSISFSCISVFPFFIFLFFLLSLLSFSASVLFGVSSAQLLPRHLVLFLGRKPKEPWRGRSNLR